ncbi:hypothetical protein D9613_010721 [Agrocybe pediades]|uniref:Ubiquitin-like protease family profile domain-containing protein n=1 Tax=Agrocybe pediades TaxID=84607 RepID=A0A8H4QKR5_9AGAR|nr:hypothetical protein D9613_010721 [Agrocybe pediades]
METLAEDLLSIPPDIQDHILPRRTLSVAEFLKFPLPSPTPRHTVTDVDLYLSSFHPTVTCTDKILDIPIPPTTVLLNLTKSVKTHDTNSILCPHTSELQEEQRLPLWIVDYWTQISAIQPVQQKWKCAAKNLQELENVEDKEHSGNRKTLSEIRDMLHWIGWAEKINGFPASISTVFLTPYFTKQWLTDEQENQMLHLLEKDVRADISNNYIEVLPTYFTESLTAAYQSPETYPTDPRKAWIRKKGHDLQSNSGILATLANINGNHWVAVVLDFRSAEIHYGDSMGGSIRKKLEDMLMWWTYQHTGRHFTTSYLPISRQKDGYSCGILSWSALATYVLPTQYTLMKTDQLTMERLKMFLVVTKHHISESVVADTEGRKKETTKEKGNRDKDDENDVAASSPSLASSLVLILLFCASPASTVPTCPRRLSAFVLFASPPSTRMYPLSSTRLRLPPRHLLFVSMPSPCTSHPPRLTIPISHPPHSALASPRPRLALLAPPSPPRFTSPYPPPPSSPHTLSSLPRLPIPTLTLLTSPSTFLSLDRCRKFPYWAISTNHRVSLFTSTTSSAPPPSLPPPSLVTTTLPHYHHPPSSPPPSPPAPSTYTVDTTVLRPLLSLHPPFAGHRYPPATPDVHHRHPPTLQCSLPPSLPPLPPLTRRSTPQACQPTNPPSPCGQLRQHPP